MDSTNYYAKIIASYIEAAKKEGINFFVVENSIVLSSENSVQAILVDSEAPKSEGAPVWGRGELRPSGLIYLASDNGAINEMFVHKISIDQITTDTALPITIEGVITKILVTKDREDSQYHRIF